MSHARPFNGSAACQQPPVSERSGMGLFISAGLHLLLCCALAATLPAMPSPLPSRLLEVDLVEGAGARGGGSPSATGQARQGAKTEALTALPPQKSRPDLAPRVPEAGQTDPRTILDPVSTGSSAGGTVGATGAGDGTGAGGGSSPGNDAGQGGVAVDRMPEAVKRVKPTYPEEARRQGITGRVLLRVHIDAVGSVREVLVQSAEPAGFFEVQAVEALRKWRFKPGVRLGEPVPAWLLIPIRFALE